MTPEKLSVEERIADLFDKYEVFLSADMFDEIHQVIKKVREEALEESAKALDPLYGMKGSENDGMIFIPDAQKAIRALKREGGENR